MNATMTGFDAIAARYDDLWTASPVGDIQRRAVWGHMDRLFQAGESVLDLGCGTGADAVHLQELGIRVVGIDSSAEMVRIARSKGVDAHHLRLEDLALLSGSFDGAISNFGALNCVESLASGAMQLSRLVRSGGYLALCFLGRVCFWELAYYLTRGEFRKALRRLPGRANSSYNIDVLYPLRRTIVRAFAPSFRLVKHVGIGLTVPPSYVRVRDPKWFADLDARLASKPFFRSLSDHQLYIWRRV